MSRSLVVLFMSLFLFGCVSTNPQQNLNDLSPDQLNELALKLWVNDKYTNPELAIQYADIALSKDPSYDRAHYTKGFAYYNLRKYDLSIQSFTKSIELNPNIPEAYNGRGWVYGELNDYVSAITDFSKAIEIYPEYSVAYNNRALAYIHINNNEMACKDFQKVCEIGDCQNIKHAKKIGKCM